MNRDGLMRQWQWGCLAVSFLTRLPVRIRGEVTPQALGRCHRWFSLVGALIGLGLALVYWGIEAYLPSAVAVFMVLGLSLWLTGALHEDGLADCMDGLGGGQDVAQRLAIMKDSRVGSYGVLALSVSLVGRWLLLSALAQQDAALVMVALITSHSLSRGLAAFMMGLLPYLRSDGHSKVQALTGHQRGSDRGWLAGIAVIVAVLAAGVASGLVLLLTTALSGLVLYRWLNRQLGGVTGDALGAVQQITEILLYLVLVVLHA
ncbi:adenosylcobinamide-GDP ribazoletransferase [Kushneria indalinina]|uniref:Adenosylcobinamide-GDP ribazoletransferase n=1 Tax=Kushneria indalinina DSM 14324 TaxID=1122140 RepID=A0A3D9DZD0_9GAMM|nr:adenosylcobinamide-GDP ribazoletransferase [Kushneria indalinina]REC96160.1 cobalamin-5'-phosphate synthase [Kushneria indalinina DSM 14324]